LVGNPVDDRAGASVDGERASRTAPRPWYGTPRYAMVRRIGEGGMGAVYEAFDQERQQAVAVKTLLRFSPAGLYRFKQEFRTLADVTHPNLVRLYELVAIDAENVFFTMELIRGVRFTEHVGAPPASPGAASATKTVRGPQVGREEGADRLSAPVRAGRSPADPDRLRPALRQLVEGVHALHLAGKLHRDIKPSNVLVTPEGRVVVLDFGVATELGRPASEVEDEVVGTVRYMAPEQALGEAPTEASDWYSVGVVLHEALVGRAPFTGSDADVLARKVRLDPPPPGEYVGGVPPDLDQLCADLLRCDPSARPTGQQILARLSRRSDGAVAAPSGGAGPGSAPLVGREGHLAALEAAYDDARSGAPVAVMVTGAPGMGKSSLLERFLDDLVERRSAIVLRARVYERETVPYKAFDGVADALSRHLRRAGSGGDAFPLPEEMGALARLFPVLRGVPGTPVGAARQEDRDPHRVRRAALSALRAVVSGLSRAQPLVVCVDDAHWGDVDSASLLLELLKSGAFLLLGSAAREAHDSALLREMRAQWPLSAELRELPVGPLDPGEAQVLALTLLGSHRDDALREAQAIASESGGSPFLVEELVRSSTTRGRRELPASPGASPAAPALERMVTQRLAQLPSGDRTLLELVALSRQPLDLTLASRAADLRDGAEDAVARLQACRFVRAGYRGGREVVEIAHGRFAEAIVARLPEAVVAAHHGRLAYVLESAPEVNAEALAMHLLASGDDARGAEWAERAAEEAAAKLAFDQAARLFRLALERREAQGAAAADLARLRMRLGEADGHLSSVGLDGPLKGRVEELVRMQREIEDLEERLARVKARAGEGGGPVPDEERGLERRLALARARFQEAVVDLPIDEPGAS
jgi:hypothetical protein